MQVEAQTSENRAELLHVRQERSPFFLLKINRVESRRNHQGEINEGAGRGARGGHCMEEEQREFTALVPEASGDPHSLMGAPCHLLCGATSSLAPRGSVKTVIFMIYDDFALGASELFLWE